MNTGFTVNPKTGAMIQTAETKHRRKQSGFLTTSKKLESFINNLNTDLGKES
jgi:hypothetical protein